MPPPPFPFVRPQPHWPLPPKLLGRALPHLAYTRALPRLLLPPYYDASPGQRALSVAVAPLRRLFWWGLQRRQAARHGVRGDTCPPVGLAKDVLYGVQVRLVVG